MAHICDQFYVKRICQSFFKNEMKPLGTKNKKKTLKDLL